MREQPCGVYSIPLPEMNTPDNQQRMREPLTVAEQQRLDELNQKLGHGSWPVINENDVRLKRLGITIFEIRGEGTYHAEGQ